MAGRRVLRSLLVLVVCATFLPSAQAFAGSAPGTSTRITANQSAECAQLAWYLGQMNVIGGTIDSEESSVDTDNMETWTATDYDNAIAVYGTILAQLDSITPPTAAIGFHQAIRASVALFQEALGTMKTAGPFAILAYLDQFDLLNQKAGAEALPLEAACNIALFDNDNDGEPEVGPGVATPESGGDFTFDEATPDTDTVTIAEEPTATAMTFAGSPLVPIGTTVQTSDAFSLTVISVDQNDVDAVSDPAPDGYQYVNAEIKLGHLRDQTDTFALGSLIAVGPGGAIYSAVGNGCGDIDFPLPSGDYGGTVNMTGHVCFVVNSRDISGLAMFDQTQDPNSRVYLSLDPNA